VGHVAGRRGQGPDAFQDQVLHRAGHRVRIGLEHLGDQQRVPAGQPVDRLGVAAGPVRLGEHALSARARDHHAGRDGGRHRAEDTAKRVVRADLVVAVGHDEQRRQPLHPPGQEHQPVQGRLVGPVRVLDHHHLQSARVRGQLVEERREELLLGRPAGEPLGQHATRLPADVVQRAEGARRDQPVAATPQHPGPVLDPTSELGDQGRLPDARLAGHQRHPAAGRARPQLVVELLERRGALPQLHAWIVGGSRRRSGGERHLLDRQHRRRAQPDADPQVVVHAVDPSTVTRLRLSALPVTP
jgi:hypothetical protein